MNIELIGNPLPLMAIALNTMGVLLGLSATVLFIAGYIFFSRQSSKKREEKTRMLNNTSLNKKIGMVASIAIALIIMSWTSAYRPDVVVEGTLEEGPSDYLEDMIVFQEEKKLPPPPTVEPPKLITDLFKIDEKEPDDSKDNQPKTGDPDGNGPEPITNPGPPTAPKLAPPKPIEVKPLPPEPAPITFASQMPRFCGCEDLAADNDGKKNCADLRMKNYLNKIVKYPPIALDNRIEGKVYVRFVVERDGSLSNIEIAKDATSGGGLAAAAQRAVERMAKEECWVPGQQDNHKVRVRITIPIVFKINQ